MKKFFWENRPIGPIFLLKSTFFLMFAGRVFDTAALRVVLSLHKLPVPGAIRLILNQTIRLHCSCFQNCLPNKVFVVLQSPNLPCPESVFKTVWLTCFKLNFFFSNSINSKLACSNFVCSNFICPKFFFRVNVCKLQSKADF